MKDKWKTNDTAAFEARLYDILGIATVEDDDEDDLLQLIVEDRRIKQRLADLEGQLLAEQEDARVLAAELKQQKKAATEEIQSLAESNIFLRNRVDDINKKANGCATVLGEKRGTIHRIIDALGIEAEVYDCRKIVDAITKLKDLLRTRLEPYEAVYEKLMAEAMGRRHLKAPIGDKIATLMLVVEALGIDANICERDKIIDAIEKLKAIRAHVRFEDGLESKVGQGESVFLVDLDKKGKVKGQVSVTVS